MNDPLHAVSAGSNDIGLAVVDENAAFGRQAVAFAEHAIDTRVGFHQPLEPGNDDAVEVLEERPFPKAGHPLLPREIGDRERRQLGGDQLLMDFDRAMDEVAERFLPAGVVGLDLAPVSWMPGDQLGDALGINVAGVELEIPVLGADVVLEPLRLFLGGEELAE